MQNTTKPVLIFTWGNPSRGDDAIGPRVYDLLLKEDLADVELLTDFQLQIEHTVDLDNRERVLFVDASVSAAEPCEFYRLKPASDDSFTTHAMSPASLLATYVKVNNQAPPPAYMLSIRGYSFDLGLSISEQAGSNLEKSLMLIKRLVSENNGQNWDELTIKQDKTR
jgi:hydrogenase maturation protease